jgi:hypothetical protein
MIPSNLYLFVLPKIVGSFHQFLTHLETSETAANDKKKTNMLTGFNRQTKLTYRDGP